MGVLSRVLRRALYRLAHGAVRRRKLIGAAFVLAAGAIVVSTFSLVSNPLSTLSTARGRTSDTGGVAYQTSDTEPNSTAAYIRGQQTGDAKLVWDAYSDRAKRDLQSRRVSVDDIQRQLDQLQQNGSTIQGVNYVGAYPIPSGSMHFYVLARAGRTRGDVAYVPYVFTLDATGKIERID